MSHRFGNCADWKFVRKWRTFWESCGSAELGLMWTWHRLTIHVEVAQIDDSCGWRRLGIHVEVAQLWGFVWKLRRSTIHVEVVQIEDSCGSGAD